MEIKKIGSEKLLRDLSQKFADGELVIQFEKKPDIHKVIYGLFDLIQDFANDDYDTIVEKMEQEWSDYYGVEMGYRIKDNKLMFKHIDKHIAKGTDYAKSSLIVKKLKEFGTKTKFGYLLEIDEDDFGIGLADNDEGECVCHRKLSDVVNALKTFVSDMKELLDNLDEDFD